MATVDQQHGEHEVVVGPAPVGSIHDLDDPFRRAFDALMNADLTRPGGKAPLCMVSSEEEEAEFAKIAYQKAGDIPTWYEDRRRYLTGERLQKNPVSSVKAMLYVGDKFERAFEDGTIEPCWVEGAIFAPNQVDMLPSRPKDHNVDFATSLMRVQIRETGRVHALSGSEIGSRLIKQIETEFAGQLSQTVLENVVSIMGDTFLVFSNMYAQAAFDAQSVEEAMEIVRKMVRGRPAGFDGATNNDVVSNTTNGYWDMQAVSGLMANHIDRPNVDMERIYRPERSADELILPDYFEFLNTTMPKLDPEFYHGGCPSRRKRGQKKDSTIKYVGEYHLAKLEEDLRDRGLLT